MIKSIICSLIIKLLLPKGGELMMAMFFAQRVILGKTSFDDVPTALKAATAEILKDSGLAELITDPEYK